MAAVKKSYDLTRQLKNATVNIYLNPDVEHFILHRDAVYSNVNWEKILDATFKLNIL